MPLRSRRQCRSRSARRNRRSSMRPSWSGVCSPGHCSHRVADLRRTRGRRQKASHCRVSPGSWFRRPDAMPCFNPARISGRGCWLRARRSADGPFATWRRTRSPWPRAASRSCCARHSRRRRCHRHRRRCPPSPAGKPPRTRVCCVPAGQIRSSSHGREGSSRTVVAVVDVLLLMHAARGSGSGPGWLPAIHGARQPSRHLVPQQPRPHPINRHPRMGNDGQSLGRA